MEPLHLAHLIARHVAGRGDHGSTLRVRGLRRGVPSRGSAIHYNVDKFGELPILSAVLVTGTILTVRAWPLTPLDIIKIATSLLAVGSALICVRWVFQRWRIEDVNVLLRFRRRIWALAAVAAIFATRALYLGWSISGDSCQPCHVS